MDYPTLTRFFALHYLLPLIIVVVMLIHVLYLHETGSNNPLGVGRKGDKLGFHPYFSLKDVWGGLVGVGGVYFLFFQSPESFVEYQNFIPANFMVTPPHIQPEWYFLSAYAVLRAIPRKLGGVLALVGFVLVYYFLPLLCRGLKVNRGGLK